MPQEDKIFLNLAGEFAVASELNRRRVLASVTYGASKSADIFAVNPDMTRIVRIEVKTTQKGKWPIGEKAEQSAASSPRALWARALAQEATLSFRRMAIIGHQLVKADWSRFSPTKAVKRNQYEFTQYPRARETSTKNPAMSLR
jgi:hypothetical protein